MLIGAYGYRSRDIAELIIRITEPFQVTSVGLQPRRTSAGEGVLDTADDDEVQRVAVPRAILIGGATRQRLQRRRKFRVVCEVDDAATRRNVVALEDPALLVVGPQAGDRSQ